MIELIFRRVAFVVVTRMAWQGLKVVHGLVQDGLTSDEERAKNEAARAWGERREKERALEASERDRIFAEQRDAAAQSEPFIYDIGRHANEALAYRYGIANLQAASQDRKRNPRPNQTIRIRKTRRVGPDTFRAVLPDFRDREVRVVIEKGKSYVKTFLPMNDAWFEQFAELELAVKGGRTFTLKELARLHVEKTVPQAVKRRSFPR